MRIKFKSTITLIMFNTILRRDKIKFSNFCGSSSLGVLVAKIKSCHEDPNPVCYRQAARWSGGGSKR